MMWNGEFLDKGPTQPLDNFDFLAENTQSWDYSDPNDRSLPSTVIGPHVGGKHLLKEHDDITMRMDK